MILISRDIPDLFHEVNLPLFFLQSAVLFYVKREFFSVRE